MAIVRLHTADPSEEQEATSSEVCSRARGWPCTGPVLGIHFDWPISGAATHRTGVLPSVFLTPLDPSAPHLHSANSIQPQPAISAPEMRQPEDLFRGRRPLPCAHVRAIMWRYLCGLSEALCHVVPPSPETPLGAQSSMEHQGCAGTGWYQPSGPPLPLQSLKVGRW